jgi:alkaline phosphatase D
MKNVVSKGKAYTSADVDYTVKVIAEGLKPATVYYYSFSACNGAVKTVVGTTKTLPRADANVNSVAFATVSCSYYSYGSFHAYSRIADKAKDLDVVLHLGKHYNESCILNILLCDLLLQHMLFQLACILFIIISCRLLFNT